MRLLRRLRKLFRHRVRVLDTPAANPLEIAQQRIRQIEAEVSRYSDAGVMPPLGLVAELVDLEEWNTDFYVKGLSKCCGAGVNGDRCDECGDKCEVM